MVNSFLIVKYRHSSTPEFTLSTAAKTKVAIPALQLNYRENVTPQQQHHILVLFVGAYSPCSHNRVALELDTTPPFTLTEGYK